MVGSAQRALELSTRAVVNIAPTGELHIIPIERNASEQGFPSRIPGLYLLDTSSTLSHPMSYEL